MRTRLLRPALQLINNLVFVTIVTCVTIWMNLLEFVKVLCLKSVVIMQTNLCSGDLEMLFTTLGMFANHSASLVTAHIALDEKLVT